jgi:hypothetical protein
MAQHFENGHSQLRRGLTAGIPTGLALLACGFPTTQGRVQWVEEVFGQESSPSQEGSHSV